MYRGFFCAIQAKGNPFAFQYICPRSPVHISMKSIIPLLLLIFSCTLFSQNSKLLFENYDQFKEPTINNRRFKHGDILPLVNRLKSDPQFKVKELGKSVEGRSIHLISIGSGKTDVLLWSQMHGDEPTATMALMDIFNFFSQKNEFEDLKNLLKKELTIHFIPMLNPDGAEKYQRRNALGVDLNRDALRLQNPESQILKMVRDSLNAEWGFNLHDQSRYYSAGRQAKTASISFLAPAYNYEKNINEVRKNAMRLIGVMDNVLQKYIPGKTARYSDEFEPRAFGDNITKWGTSTILIESGGLENDPEKQYLRKLNFVILMSAFQAIADRSYLNKGLDIYQRLPFNRSGAFNDLTLRKANVEKGGRIYILDIAFRQNEIDEKGYNQFYYNASISDIGDLSTSYSYEELDASGYKLEYGKIYPETIENTGILKEIDLLQLLENGFLYFRLKNIPEKADSHLLPFSLLGIDETIDNEIGMGKNPSLLLIKNDQVEKILVNGMLYDLKKDKEKIMRLISRF